MTAGAPVCSTDPYDWRESLLAANGWLFFLLFPLVSIAFSDISTPRKIVGYVLIAAFAVVHVAAYRAMAIRESALAPFSGQEPTMDWSLSPWLFLTVFVAISATGLALAGPGLLGFVPFIVVFGVFNFRWAIAGVIFAGCAIACFVVPIVYDLFPELMFFLIIVVSTGAGASFTRMAEQTSLERAALQTDLAVSSERNRVARDVHDVLGHSLTAVILKTQVCSRLLETLDPADEKNRSTIDKMRSELDELDTVSRQAMAEIRSTVGGLRVANLSDEIAAARAVLADAGVSLTVQGESAAVPPQHATTLAWVTRESITNVVRHAKAANCRIEFPSGSGEPLIRITDDGVGFGGSSPGNGIRGMQERVSDAGLQLQTSPASDRGTRVEVRV